METPEDTNNTENTTTEDTTPAPRTNTVTERVADQLKSISETVNEKVISVLVEREVNKKTDQLVSAIDALQTMERELRKIKPDIEAYDDNGKLVSANWSKAKLEERKKLNERINKARKAINMAVEKGDYSKVGEVK